MRLRSESCEPVVAEINLPVSKSECNRALMLSAWSGGKIQAGTISDANDSLILSELLSRPDEAVYNAADAGTAFRFLAAFLGLNNKQCRLEGTERMHERPVATLTRALRELGCRIDYAGREDFPPLLFRGYAFSGKNELHFDRPESSQFISALMMAAPSLPDGLILTFGQKPASFPYIELTAGMMSDCGLEVYCSETCVRIPAQPWQSRRIQAGADWSAASYFYGILACLPVGSSFLFPGLFTSSHQGDKILRELFLSFGIQTTSLEKGTRIENSGGIHPENVFSYDFEDCPDLALTFIALCASLGLEGRFSGLASLQIKESRRLQVIQSELKKAGIELEADGEFKTAYLKKQQAGWPETVPTFQCHKDHRIAMALSILLAGKTRTAGFDEADVVTKSFPGYWTEIQKAGFNPEF